MCTLQDMRCRPGQRGRQPPADAAVAPCIPPVCCGTMRMMVLAGVERGANGLEGSKSYGPAARAALEVKARASAGRSRRRRRRGGSGNGASRDKVG